MAQLQRHREARLDQTGNDKNQPRHRVTFPGPLVYPCLGDSARARKPGVPVMEPGWRHPARRRAATISGSWCWHPSWRPHLTCGPSVISPWWSPRPLPPGEGPEWSAECRAIRPQAGPRAGRADRHSPSRAPADRGTGSTRSTPAGTGSRPQSRARWPIGSPRSRSGVFCRVPSLLHLGDKVKRNTGDNASE